jgi:PST family polysaccharide transporter
LNSIAVAVRILTIMGVNKVLAVQLGPSGYALIGRFQNFIAVLTTLASGATASGVTKYIAEYHDNLERQNATIKTAGTVSLAVSLSLGISLILLRDELAKWILLDAAFGGVFIWFGFGLTAYTLNAFLLALINGKKDINRYVMINIIGSLMGGGATAILASIWGLYGALIALVVNQSLVFIITIFICSNASWFGWRNLWGKVDVNILRNLGGFAIMTAVSAICMPASQMIVRSHIGREFGLQAAGHWEAVMRVSNLYLMLFTTPLAVYYLPRLSEIRDGTELKREIWAGYRLILPTIALGAVLIYLCREWVVRIAFTVEFMPVTGLLGWQLTGDIAKIGSWLLAYVMLSKAMVRAYVTTEVVFGFSWIVLSKLFTYHFGPYGAQMAYCANYNLYWLVLFVILRKKVL